ncbi:Dabb family protein [Neolewinella litorea]|uniref:Dabb family protein n=1 Tax=Neolewinella litorea TaxID=2562452 RepID=A0A4V3XLT0_9BACT|nr:Dabb family protein [Neolewinella litorea]THH41833.1 Dabb family protein [Neolewinella litorea]
MNILRLLPLLLLGLLTACQEELPPPAVETPPTMEDDRTASPDSLLRHAVFFAFKDDATPAQIDSVQQAFSALPEQIEQIRDFEWGVNNSPEGLNKGFTHAFFLTFHSEADRDAYLPHPAHQEFGRILGPHLKDVFVVDYWTR